MNLPEVVSALRGREHVVVTGPQRSGTTIAARILARELALPFIPEEAVGIDSLRRYFRLRERESRFVLQAPALCACCHLLEAAVVMMRRPVCEVRTSQARIGWRHEPEELARYFRREGCIAETKYAVWQDFQRERTGGLELDYAALAGHPLWVGAEARAGFGPRQTQR